MPSQKDKKEKQVCDFNIKHFNKKKRIAEAAGGQNRGKKPPKGPKGQQPPAGSGGTILLEFYGFYVENTLWNVYGPIDAGHSGLTASEITAVIDRITQHLSPFNLHITTDVNVYNNTAAGKRQRIIFTESHEWYGDGAGGVAYLNSFFWTEDAPAFVFTSLLGYSTHFIGEAGTHEIGHTLSLRHQVTCSNGVIVSPYNWGDGVNAPIMGASYNVPLGSWWIGPNNTGCNNIQDDAAILTQAVGAASS